jgi:hypothetical protein
MSDPLSIAASVAGLVSLSLELAKIARKDITTIVHAPREVVEFVEKLERLHEALAFIRELVEKNETFVAGSPLLAKLSAAKRTENLTLTEITVIAQCSKLLEKLKKHSSELKDGGFRGTKRRLLWFLDKEGLIDTGLELERLISRFEQCKNFEAV